MIPIYPSNSIQTKRVLRRRRRMLRSGGPGVFIFNDVPYVASDFFATLSMGWTVEAADVSSYRYAKMGKMYIIWLRLRNTSVTGTVAGANLQIKLPEGITAKRDTLTVMTAAPAAAASEAVLGFIAQGSNILTILRFSTNWVLGSNNTDVGGLIYVEAE